MNDRITVRLWLHEIRKPRPTIPVVMFENGHISTVAFDIVALRPGGFAEFYRRLRNAPYSRRASALIALAALRHGCLLHDTGHRYAPAGAAPETEDKA